jgi:glycosyltransferase involved in cell wall biosynthesis
VHYVPNGLSERLHAGWRRPAADSGGPRLAGLGQRPTLLLYTRFDVVEPERVVAILAAVRQQVPDACLLIIGQGLAGEEARVRAAAARAGLAEAIVWAGFLPLETLPEVMRQADVAIYPIDDTLVNRAKAPMKLLEMLGLGLPVVAEAVGETREYIESGATGRLVKAGDTDELARRASALLLDADDRRRLGQAARDRVWRHFNWSVLAKEVEGAYSQVRGA